jgi:hypothetical protein
VWCVCVCVRERERERMSHWFGEGECVWWGLDVCVCKRVCVCVEVREGEID